MPEPADLRPDATKPTQTRKKLSTVTATLSDGLQICIPLSVDVRSSRR